MSGVDSRNESRSPKRGLEVICAYEPGRAIDEVRRELNLTTVVKLASNENPLGPSPKVVEALNRANLELHLYPDCEGRHLREDIARRHGVAQERVILGSGSADLMRTLADAFLDRGDEGMVSDICFAVYENAIRIAGATPVLVPLTQELQYELPAMREAVTARTKMVFLASPNNPTGRLIPFDELAAFARGLPPSVLLVLDLAYAEYIDASTPYPILSLAYELSNVVLLRTFSKAYGLAGLRIGYAIASPEVVRWMARVRTPFNTSSAAQLAARVALQDEQHLARTLELNRSVRDSLLQHLGALGLRTWPSEANFVLVDTRRESEALFSALLRRGIIVRPVRHPRLSTCVRITTGTRAQNEALLAALPRALAETPLHE